MKNKSLIAVAILSFAVLSGCPFDRRAGFDLSLRIIDLQSNEPVSGVIVAVGFCSITEEDCSTALTFGQITNSDGIVPVSESSGPGCSTPVSNRLVVTVDQENDPEQIDVIVESTGQDGFVPGADYVGAQAQGDRFSVEVLECIAFEQPL